MAIWLDLTGFGNLSGLIQRLMPTRYGYMARPDRFWKPVRPDSTTYAHLHDYMTKYLTQYGVPY